MPHHRKYTTTVVGAHSVPRWYEALDRLVTLNQVLSAEDGPQALRLLASHPEVQLLFSDVILPGGMTGRQLADEAVRRQPRLKVLYTTGYARNAIVHHGRLDPGVEVVFKPFTYTEVAAKIRRVLDS